MARVTGVQEKVHLPIYDAVSVKAEEQLRKEQTSSTLKFFVDVQEKTKLETNLQSASLLPQYNTFEARAMRVVISDLPPQFPDEPTAENEEDLVVTDDEDFVFDQNGTKEGEDGFVEAESPVVADVEIDLPWLIELLHEAKEASDGYAEVPADDEAVTLRFGDTEISDEAVEKIVDGGGSVWLSVEDVQGLIDSLEEDAPPPEQVNGMNGAGNVISKLIYNTVTTLYVGEKVMIQMPTFFFPGGAGPYSEKASFITHGEPTPLATFRFAEPVYIDRQQNFRVEIEVPDSETWREIRRIYGPLQIWVVLDGYMTRDVQ
jgi:hypothetical protein